MMKVALISISLCLISLLFTHQALATDTAEQSQISSAASGAKNVDCWWWWRPRRALPPIPSWPKIARPPLPPFVRPRFPFPRFPWGPHHLTDTTEQEVDRKLAQKSTEAEAGAKHTDWWWWWCHGGHALPPRAQFPKALPPRIQWPKGHYPAFPPHPFPGKPFPRFPFPGRPFTFPIPHLPRFPWGPHDQPTAILEQSAVEVDNCWSSLVEIENCVNDITTSLFSGKLQMSVACCSAVNDIGKDCHAKTVGSFNSQYFSTSVDKYCATL